VRDLRGTRGQPAHCEDPARGTSSLYLIHAVIAEGSAQANAAEKLYKLTMAQHGN
jgi:hypothetical protein